MYRAICQQQPRIDLCDSGDRTYSIEEWNRRFSNQPTHLTPVTHDRCLMRYPIYILFFLSLAFEMGCVRPPRTVGPPTKYVLPEGFTGPVLVVFDRPNGKDFEQIDGTAIYRIPGNGILELRDRASYVLRSEQFYYEDAGGSLSEIPQAFADSEVTDGQEAIRISQLDPNGQQVYVTGRKMGKFGSSDGLVAFRRFTVGRIRDSETNSFKGDQLVFDYRRTILKSRSP